MHLQRQHVATALVALGCFGVAVDQGGFASGFIAGAALAIWWAVLIVLALRLAPEPRLPGAAIAVGATLGLLAGWTALSWLWASDDGAVMTEVVRVLLYLGLFTLVALASRRGDSRAWLGGLAIGLTAVVILALASRYFPSLVDEGFPGARLNWPVGYWNALAAAAASAIVLLAWHAVHARTAPARALAAAALPLPALVIFLSGSRGGVAAGALGVVLLVALLPRRFAMVVSLLLAAAGGAVLLVFAHGQQDLVDGLGGSAAASEGRALLAVTLAVCAAVGLVRRWLDGMLARTAVSPALRRWTIVLGAVALIGLVVAEDPIERFDRFKEPPARGEALPVSGNFTNDNGSGRYQFWDAAIDAFGEEPLHGVGAGQYGTWWNQHGSIYFVVQDAHSLLLESAAELGIVGLSLVLLLIVLPLRSGWRRRGGAQATETGALVALFATAMLSALVDWMWELPGIFGVAVVAAALLTGPATADPEELDAPESRGSARSRLRLGYATAAVAWIAIIAAGDLLLLDTKVDRSRTQLADGELSAAVENANQAIAIAPWAAEPRIYFALAQERAGNLPAARASLEDAADRAPEDWEIWFLLSRVERKEHRDRAARAALAEAIRRNPRSPFLRGLAGLPETGQ